jgi:DNA-binding phage protein
MTKAELSVSYREDLLERLRDPEYAAGYLNAALEENDEATFQLALQDVAEAQNDDGHRQPGVGESRQR